MEPIREIPQRELRNRISEVLREVKAGSSLRVTVHGQPVADLTPISRGKEFVPRSVVESILRQTQPDPDFAADIDRALDQRVDEL